MDRNKVERFFKDKCTPAEIEEVREWFQTPEGQVFLKERLDRDILQLQEEHIKPMTSEIRSQKMWDLIETGTASMGKQGYGSSSRSTSYWQATAAILLLLTATMFYVWNQVPIQDEMAAQPLSYATGDDQQKVLTLSDGTQIRLNSNAQVQIPADFNQSTREVRLRGEAFFEVSHDEAKPFIVHTAWATIKDLGTAFNVRAIPDNRKVQVAVTDGKVSVWSEKQTEEKATELTEGQFGHFDLQKGILQIEQFSTSNYLSWINGRLTYDGAHLEQVSRQLGRMYEVSFAYSDYSLKKLSVTADFERKSLEKVLEVIAMTLRIDYRIDEEKVIWLQGNHHSTKR